MISGGNLVVAEGITSFGMLDRRRDLVLLDSALPWWLSGVCVLPMLATLVLVAVGRPQSLSSLSLSVCLSFR